MKKKGAPPFGERTYSCIFNCKRNVLGHEVSAGPGVWDPVGASDFEARAKVVTPVAWRDVEEDSNVWAWVSLSVSGHSRKRPGTWETTH
jgi:hypothetical protein